MRIINIACWVILHILSPAFLFKITFFIKSFQKIKVSDSLDPDEARHFVGPSLDLKLFSYVISRQQKLSGQICVLTACKGNQQMT